MAGFTFKEKIFTAKIETVYGTDSVPTAAANAIKSVNGQITPVEGDEVVLDVDNPGLGAPEAELAGQHVSFSFDVALSGSGTPGVPPSWGVLMRASGFSETVTEDSDVVYAPIQTGFESVTLYCVLKGALHKMTGVRAKFMLRGKSKDYLFGNWAGKGLLTPVTAADGTLPAATYAGARELLVGDANTDFGLDGFAAALEEITLDMGSDPEGRFLVNQESVDLPDPVPVGTLNIADPGVATKNFFALAASRSLVPLSFKHGTVAGNIIELESDLVQLGPKIAYQESQRFRHLQVPLRYLRGPSSPFTITVR